MWENRGRILSRCGPESKKKTEDEMIAIAAALITVLVALGVRDYREMKEEKAAFRRFLVEFNAGREADEEFLVPTILRQG
jgi:hypothetical protein